MRAVERLRRRAEFQRIYREGRKAVGRYVVVFACVGGESLRFGVTATRRTGCAVVRNRARRRIRELVRLAARLQPDVAGDVVVNVRQGCAEAPWASLEQDFARCLARAAGREWSGN